MLKLLTMNIVLSESQKLIATKQDGGHYNVNDVESGSLIGVIRLYDMESATGVEWTQWKFEPSQLSFSAFMLMDLSTLPTLIRVYENGK